MVIIGRKIISVVILLFLFGAGFLSVRYLNRPRIRLGEHYLAINYRAKINLKKTYHLRLWDYKWPGPEGDAWYQPYIEAAIMDFEKENPNIKVTLRLLDYNEGPQELVKALASGMAPDVYCSVYRAPKFNYKWQIPAGIFLKPEELNVYFPRLRKLFSFANYQLVLPRWSAPGIWIGNRTLMEKAGLAIEKIQEQGWSWQDIIEVAERNKPICAGNYSANGMLPQLLISMDNRTQGDINRVLDILSFINGPLPQKDDLEANMFQRFLSGNIMFLGGVRPLVYDFIKSEASELGIGWEPVILPFPSEKPGKLLLPVETGVIGVYRNRKTRGDDQLVAATRLAYFISTYRQTIPWQRLKVIPTVPDLVNNWAQGSGWAGHSKLIGDWFSRGELINLEINPDYQEFIYPGLKSFFAGKTKREELEGILRKHYSKLAQ